MAANAAVALTVAVCLGVSPQSALRGIAAAEVGGARMRWRAARHGARLLDDSYNANPASMLAAFETLCAVPARRRVAVLGMMAELGDPSSAHRSVAEAARERGIEVIAVGTDLYGRSGVTPEAAAGLLADNLDRDTVVLVKGSRVARLERVVAQLTG